VLQDDGTFVEKNLGVLGTRAVIGSATNNPVSNFINRGEFLTADLLCANLPDDIPIEAFDDASVESETPVDLFFELRGISCATCHAVFDNYGVMFQQFAQEDSRFNENSVPFGTSFDLTVIGDMGGVFSDVEDFAAAMGESQTAAQCASELLYRHSVRRDIQAGSGDEEALEAVFEQWTNSGDTSIKSLLTLIVGSANFITLFE